MSASGEHALGIFSRFFPTPKFLEMPGVGLAIDDDAVSVVELLRHPRGFALGRFGRRTLPTGSIAGGYVHNQDAVVDEIGKLKDDLRIEFVHASLSDEKAYLFKTKIPKLALKEIRGALEFKIEENVPISPSEAVFDYDIFTKSDHRASDHLDIGMTVLPKKVAETYVDLLGKAGLVPLSFETEAQAIARTLVAQGDTSSYLIVNFGERKTGLFIVSDEVVHFTSVVPVGGEHITEAIAKYLSVSIEEAQQIKREHRILKTRRNTDLFLSLVNTISVLKDEVNKLSVYWSTHVEPGESLPQKITKIVLCGRDASLPGFVEYLGIALEQKVVVGNVWQNVFSLNDYIPPILFDESLDYAAAIGLALPRSYHA